MADALASGTQIGKYQVLRQLAVGGMAEIYLARATSLAGFEKAVVLKRILPSLAHDPRFVDMFLDEARLTASLNHPNVVHVYDVGKIGDSYFFTMEFVHGQDLTSVLAACAKKKRGLPLSLALHVVKEVAAGLHYAHDKKGKDGQPIGTVHRDVSPKNVMIAYEGAVKIVDFGIAKAAVRVTRTESGAVKGTLWYMSPEQAQGHDLDRRSDVFSLGVLLYELTTGRRPFTGPNEYAVLFKLVNETPPLPSEIRPTYPPALETIVMKALSRRPDDRFATADELRRALDDFMLQEQLSASSSTLSSFMRELFGEREDTADLFVLPTRATSTQAGPLQGDDATRPLLPSAGSALTSVASDAVLLPVERPRLWLWALLGVAGLTVALGWQVVGGSRSPAPAPGAAPGEHVPSARPDLPAPSAAPVSSATPAPSAAPAPSATPTSSTTPASPASRREPSARPAPERTAPPVPSAGAKPREKKWDLDSPLPP